MRDIKNDAAIIANLLQRVDDLEMQMDEIEHLGKNQGYESIYTQEDIEDLLNVIQEKHQSLLNNLEFTMERLAPHYLPATKASQTDKNLKQIIVYDERHNGVKIIISYADWALTKRGLLMALLKFVEKEEQVEDEE